MRDLHGVEVPMPLPRITHQQAVARYGTDKPDLRFGMEVTDMSDAFTGTGFRGFSDALAAGGVVRGINAGPLNPSRAELDRLVGRARDLGAAGLVWAVVNDDDGWRSPAAKFLTSSEIAAATRTLDASPGDLLLLVAGDAAMASSVLGTIRLDLGRPSSHEQLRFAWIVDFPLFDTTENGELVPSHHPFTAPVSVDEMHDSPETAVAYAYDLVLNGSELGSGSVRIHDPDTQRAVFETLSISDEEGRVPIRLVPRSSQLRDTTPRWFRGRDRPPGSHPAERGQHQRSDRVPENPDRHRSAHHRPHQRGRCPSR